LEICFNLTVKINTRIKNQSQRQKSYLES